jgi:hypothetical protein
VADDRKRAASSGVTERDDAGFRPDLLARAGFRADKSTSGERVACRPTPTRLGLVPTRSRDYAAMKPAAEDEMEEDYDAEEENKLINEVCTAFACSTIRVAPTERRAPRNTKHGGQRALNAI